MAIEHGTWEHMRQSGRWHFDPDRADSPTDHKLIAKVRADFPKLLKDLPAGDTKTLRRSMEHRSGAPSFFDRIQAGNVADAERLGLDPDLAYASVFDAKSSATEVPVISRLLSRLPLDEPYWKFHRQRPGQVWPVHFDNYHAFDRTLVDGDEWADPGVRRLWLMLADWQWGQFIQIGNSVWSHWHAGDVLYFDWLIPHGSANCGHSDRVSLLVTGRNTPDLQQWVKGNSPQEIDLR